MSTAAQIEANRLNAQKSTGPTSPEGKAKTRFNALKHGADAQSLVIPGEDAAARLEHAREYYEEFQPEGIIETELVDIIITASWEMRRVPVLETALLNTLIAKQESPDCALGAAVHEDACGPNGLQKLFRRGQAAQRTWLKSIAELRRLQEQRLSAAPAVAQPSKPLPAPVPAPVSLKPIPVPLNASVNLDAPLNFTQKNPKPAANLPFQPPEWHR